MKQIGAKLRAVRMKWGLTLRDDFATLNWPHLML